MPRAARARSYQRQAAGGLGDPVQGRGELGRRAHARGAGSRIDCAPKKAVPCSASTTSPGRRREVRTSPRPAQLPQQAGQRVHGISHRQGSELAIADPGAEWLHVGRALLVELLAEGGVPPRRSSARAGSRWSW
ncbi:MAG: hypothetical protein ACRDN0_10920 [Trebonia sp.]